MNKTLLTSFMALGITFQANAMDSQKGGFVSEAPQTATVVEALEMPDDTKIVMVGQIIEALGDEKYIFKDASGQTEVEIDEDNWNGVNATPETVVIIEAEIDKGMFATEIEVDSVKLK
ncbi:MAG: NirD/YgiW/YdeI family stress tolerance protein [Alphaproteobacteria bacterium]